MKKIGNLHIVSLVCKELRENYEYDFDSEFWDDEMNAMLFEIIETTRNVLETNQPKTRINGKKEKRINTKKPTINSGLKRQLMRFYSCVIPKSCSASCIE